MITTNKGWHHINQINKSYNDYRLFDDGYVESLSTATVKECGIHVYVEKMQPTMRLRTHEGRDFYELWFILEGKGPNRGSVLNAVCKCKGGRDETANT